MYLDGEIDEQEKNKIEEHLALCPECRQKLQELSSMKEQLTSAFTMIEIPDRIEDKVLSGIRQAAIHKYTWAALTFMIGFGLLFLLSMIQIFTAGLHIFQTTFSISRGLIYAFPSIMGTIPNMIVVVSIFIVMFITMALIMLRYLVHTMGKKLRVEDI